jgi:hypothetical protein
MFQLSSAYPPALILLLTKKWLMKRRNINTAIRSRDSRAGRHEEQRCFGRMTGV